MFAGIIQAVGAIVSVAPGPAAARLRVDPRGLSLDDVAIGDSIAVDGCCLTVVGIEGIPDAPRLAFDVSAATLACTAGLGLQGPVNLEKALRFADRVGGHFLTGHVDGVGTVVLNEPAFGEDGTAGSRRVVIEAPTPLARFIATKGSIAVQGVSLTVNTVAATRFEVNLIPHTLEATTLKALVPGARVNLEIDLVARYVARLAEFDGGPALGVNSVER